MSVSRQQYRVATYAVLNQLKDQGSIRQFAFSEMERLATSEAPCLLGAELIASGIAANPEAAAAAIFGRLASYPSARVDGQNHWKDACRLAMKNAGAGVAERQRVASLLIQKGEAPGWISSEVASLWGADIAHRLAPLPVEKRKLKHVDRQRQESTKKSLWEWLGPAAVLAAILCVPFGIAAANGFAWQLAGMIAGVAVLMAALQLALFLSRLSSSAKLAPLRWIAFFGSVAIGLTVVAVFLAVLGWHLFFSPPLDCATPGCRYE